MRSRRRILGLLVAGFLALTLGGLAQTSGKVYRIGFLGARSRSTPAHPDVYYDAWLDAMRELGYVEGKNLFIEWRFADNDLARIPALAAELAAMKLDAIVTHGLPATLALKRATSRIPIVFMTINDPVGNGVVASLARPGGNITGISFMGVDLSAKRVELLKGLIPNLREVAVLVNPDTPSSPTILTSTRDAAANLGMRVRPIVARNREEIERAFATAARERAGAVIAPEDAIFLAYRIAIAKSATTHRIPLMVPWRDLAEAGALMSYGTNTTGMYRHAAVYVDKVLKGATPADIPVEQPTRFELVINKRTAKALGLEIPAELLVQADRVIE